MFEKLKVYTDKVTVPVSGAVKKLTDKLSPTMRKVFCVAMVCVWVALLLPISLLKVLPVVGEVALIAWVVLSLLVGKVVYDVWQAAKTPDASP